MNTIELNQAMCTIARAHVEASKFPGLSIVPWDTQDWTYDIAHSVDEDFDRVGVAIADLVREVQCMVAELEARYDDGGEQLGGAALDNPFLS